MGLFSKLKKGFKKGVGKITKGTKRTFGKTVKGLKASGFNKNFGKDFAKGFAMAGKALQVPEKFITANDPLAKKMGGLGFLSPISLAGSILTAPLTSVGVVEELAGSKKKQKKLRKGDADTITDLALAPLPFIPLGAGGSAVKKGAKSVGKSLSRGIGRGLSKLF